MGQFVNTYYYYVLMTTKFTIAYAKIATSNPITEYINVFFAAATLFALPAEDA